MSRCFAKITRDQSNYIRWIPRVSALSKNVKSVSSSSRVSRKSSEILSEHVFSRFHGHIKYFDIMIVELTDTWHVSIFKKYVVFDSNPMIHKKQKTFDPEWKRSHSISSSKKTFNTKKKIVKWNSVYMYQINLGSSDTSYHNTGVLVYCVLTIVRSRILIVARSRASRHSHISRHISTLIRKNTVLMTT